jgi:hypothetical protein
MHSQRQIYLYKSGCFAYSRRNSKEIKLMIKPEDIIKVSQTKQNLMLTVQS